MASPLVSHLVTQLIQRIETSGDLPSIAQLCREWDVSYPTMSKAMKVLADRGVVARFSGRRARVTASAGTLPQMPPSARLLHDKLRQQILSGALRTGGAIPKVQYFTASEHASSHTVIRALHALESDHLVHKRGRQWIVGPAPQLSMIRPLSHPRTILLLAPYASNRTELYDLGFMGRFVVPFTEEISRAGVRQQFVEKIPIASDPRIQRAALSDANKRLRALGDRYLGAFIHRGPFRFEEHQDNMDSWVHLLADYAKPVVFFDASDTGSVFSRDKYATFQRYYRFHFDHRAAVDMAVTALVKAGHRRIGLPVPTAQSWVWAESRARMAQEIASKIGGVNVTVVMQDEPIWHPFNQNIHESMYDRILALDRRRGNPADRTSRRRELLDHTKSFKELLDHGVTAILSPNDETASVHYQWLVEAGFEVPRDISVLGFDNRLDGTTLPLSTIDFGFAQLGYAAAHLLLDDLPGPSTRTGDVPGTCTYVDKGSVGQPRKRSRDL